VHREPGRWVEDLAEALAAIHDVALPADLPVVLRAPHAGLAWRPPEPATLRRTDRVERLVAVALQLQHDLATDPAKDVLLHHDFHHGNVTWRAARLAGVLDWNEARIGPAASDVAYCSVDLAMTHGATTAHHFARAYRAAGGQELDDLPRWQALWITNDMRWVGYWVTGFREAGLDHLTLPVLRRATGSRIRPRAGRRRSRLRRVGRATRAGRTPTNDLDPPSRDDVRRGRETADLGGPMPDFEWQSR
jgi:Ser/Thr protein kinase RdoA (MazF antagonist)